MAFEVEKKNVSKRMPHFLIRKLDGYNGRSEPRKETDDATG